MNGLGLRRRRILVSLLAGGGLLATGHRPRAEDGRFMRIGTGPINGTYYPVGELIASVVSSPPGARPCGPEGGCGVPGLLVVVQTSKGSVDNVTAIQAGEVESGFSQSDVTWGAFSGTGIFAGRPPMQNLRALASLYLEGVHLVARAGSGIRTLADLRGRRVSLDVEGSGTLVGARLVLEGAGLSEETVQAVHAPLGRSIDLMRAGEIDALFFVGGYPANAVSELARDTGAGLVPIAGHGIERLLKEHRFFSAVSIPGGTYPNLPEATPTIGVAALWVVAAGLDEALVYALTEALWHPSAVKTLAEGHPKGQEIRLEDGLRGVAIPVHPGAARFYREHGIAEGGRG
jgi:TRAP transporter TAXI family solute receptor